MTSTAKTSKPNPTPRWRRWLWRVAIAAAGLIVLIFIAGEIVFATNLPRDLALSALQQTLGLRIEAQSLSTGWLGHSSLRNVAISLPLSPNAIVEVPSLEIRHTNVAWILLGGSISVDEISADNPRFHFIQSPGGGWNFEDAVRILARAAGPPTEDHKIPVLPALNINNADVVVTDNRNRSTTIANLYITAYPDGPLVWQYHAAVANHLDIAGTLAPGGDWEHEFTAYVQDAKPWARPWDATFPPDAHLGATWRGRIDNGALAGRLSIAAAAVGDRFLTGAIDVSIQNGALDLQPVDLSVDRASSSIRLARFDSGQISVSGGSLEIQNLLVDFAGGRGAINAKCELAAPRFNADFNGQGALPDGKWTAHITLDGGGDSFQSISASLAAPTLRFDRASGSSIDLSGFSAQLQPYPGGLAVADLHVSNAYPILGQGGYAFKSGVAWVSLDARAWPVPDDPSRSLDFDLNAWSSPDGVHLDHLYARSGLFTACLTGDWVFQAASPVVANLWIVATPRAAAADAATDPFRGAILGNLDLIGSASPPDLTLSGWALGSDVHVGRRALGDIRIALAGRFHDNQFSLASQDIQLLGGTWNVSGVWPVRDALFRLDNLSVRNLPLARLANDDRVAGKLDGKWWVNVRQMRRDGVEVGGAASVTGVAFNDPTSRAASMLAIDKIQMPDIRLEEGYLSARNITFLRKTADASGKATVDLSTDLASPGEISMSFNTDSWPVHPDDIPADALVSSRGKLDFDIPHESAFGNVDVKTENMWKSRLLSEVSTHLDITGRAFRADPIHITRQGGTATGSAQIDLDHLYQTVASLDWKNLDLGDMSRFFTNTGSLQGKISGSLRIAPDTNPRALGPLAVKLRVQNTDVHYENLAIGDGELSAHVGPGQLVLDDSWQNPTQIAVAGGTLGVWARISRHPEGIYQTLINLYLNDLDLNVLLPTGSKVGMTPGRLSGQITAIGEPGNPRNAFGQGTLTLTDSDLAGTGPISFLYDLMHFSHNANKPQGQGTIDFVIQDQTAYISPMQYFDRGRQVLLSGVISDLPDLPHCPIDLIAAGSVRPFKSINIFGVEDLDEALSALQHDAVSVHITGYLNKPVTKAIAFGNISHEARNLLLGIFSPGGG